MVGACLRETDPGMSQEDSELGGARLALSTAFLAQENYCGSQEKATDFRMRIS